MSLKGKVVVFTGKCSLSRAGMSKEAEEHGLVVGKSITKKTDYLVSGDQIAANATGSKYKKALANDVTILHEDEYRALLAGKSSGTKKAAAKKTTKTTKTKKTGNTKKYPFDWIGDFRKADLVSLLKRVDDSYDFESKTRSILVDALKNHPTADIIDNLSASQAQELSFKTHLAFKPEESINELKKRLQSHLA